MNAERKKPSSQLDPALGAAPRPESTSRAVSSGSPPAWTGLSWKSLLGLEDAPPRNRSAEGSTSNRPSETRRATKQRLSPSAGFYSTKPDAEDATLSIPAPVVIPKAPQLPTDLVGTHGLGSAPSSVNAGPPSAAPASSTAAPASFTAAPVSFTAAPVSFAPPPVAPPHFEEATEGLPPPSVAFAHFPPPLESTASDERAGRSSLQFPAHIREQAEGWLKSGSLSLPNCSSPRHARAMQRALLLALLDRPGYHRLPLGLQQRVGWLLSPGWERQTTGSVASEASDLLTVLCVASGAGAMQTLMSALRVLVPDPLPLVRPPSSYPPARR